MKTIKLRDETTAEALLVVMVRVPPTSLAGVGVGGGGRPGVGVGVFGRPGVGVGGRPGVGVGVVLPEGVGVTPGMGIAYAPQTEFRQATGLLQKQGVGLNARRNGLVFG